VSEANLTQIGGIHYRQGGLPQHWDMCYLLDWNYFLCAATKYLDRLGKKDCSLTEMRKAKHYLEKYIELRGEDNIPVAAGNGPVIYMKFIDWARAREYSVFQISVWTALISQREDLAVQYIEEEINGIEATRAYVAQG
jgi:hypothetical protein